MSIGAAGNSLSGGPPPISGPPIVGPLIVGPLIVGRGLTKTYRMGDQEVRALAGVDIDIAEGDYVAVTGASGSGKSTLMGMLGALDQPSSGSLHIAGRELSRLSPNDLAAFRNEVVGFVFQQFHLLRRTAAVDNVMLPLLYGRHPGDKRARALECLAMVGLAERWHHQPSQLSGGQQQRVAIARALVNRPRILLADEPTGALDSRTSDEIMDIFDRLNREEGITIVLVTHEADVAARARRKLVFRDGLIAEDVRQDGTGVPA
ncbi:MAG: hypothetical protein RLY86_1310 [Pseudomonadota bacterium]